MVCPECGGDMTGLGGCPVCGWVGEGFADDSADAAETFGYMPSGDDIIVPQRQYTRIVCNNTLNGHTSPGFEAPEDNAWVPFAPGDIPF